MSMRIKRVIIIQDASCALSSIFVRRVLAELSLTNGDKLRILGILQAFTENTGWCLQIQKTKLHSSATINKHKQDIEEDRHNVLGRYKSCAEFKQIMQIVEPLQVEFEIVVEAGLKEVAATNAKSFQATHVILHRQLKKETEYFMQNLPCAISRMRADNSLKVIRPPQAEEYSIVNKDASNSGYGKSTNSTVCYTCLQLYWYLKYWKNIQGIGGRIKSSTQTCSVCRNKRPSGGYARKFTYAELQLATNGFSKVNLMPEHGKNIYLGLMNDERRTLIREHPSGTIKEEEFRREVLVLERVRHENVALLLGSCSEGPHKFLVYEYICNSSLNTQLSEESRSLTWEKRIKIAFGAAKGLESLHRVCIYGSMRPGNILITHDYHPFISFYGLATNQYEALGQYSSTTTVLKTFEYLSPEYEETGTDMSKADVYSFGVVLLELITGRKTIHDTNGQSLLRWARPLLRQKNYMDLIDPAVQENVDLHQLYWLVRIADKCINWDPKTRYSMNKVVEALAGIINCHGVEDFSPTEF